MRNLTKKQKKLLDKFFETIKDEPGLAVRDIVEDLLPYDLWIDLKAINDTEVLYHNVNGYLSDKA